MATAHKMITLPSGEQVSALGLGTWNMGDDADRRAEELETLQLALDLGIRLIDTAEMYGEGRAESLIGEALVGRRDEAFIVSKFYPHHATRHSVKAACERSLKRLRTDRIDLYLLHWRGETSFEETLSGLQDLQEAGKIRHYGVSNLDAADMEEFVAAGGDAVATDQVLYNLSRRGIEWELLPWLRARHIPVMAYSPLEQARLLRNRKLQDCAQRYGRSAAELALGWLLAMDDVIVIPKTGRRTALRENLRAIEQPLDAALLAELDVLFPAPQGPRALEML